MTKTTRARSSSRPAAESRKPDPGRARMHLTAAIRADAENTIYLTVEAAGRLPGFLKRIVPAMLTYHGFYTCTLDGTKTLYIARPNPYFCPECGALYPADTHTCH